KNDFKKEKKILRRNFLKKFAGLTAALSLLPSFKKLFASARIFSGKDFIPGASANNNNAALDGQSPFVAEVSIVPFNFAPRGWAMCNGQILPIAQNTALFSLLGTTYGGNGKSTFALPFLTGNFVMHPGQGPGLQQRYLGETFGSDKVTLLQSEMPAHNHAGSKIKCTNSVGTSNDPSGKYFARDLAGSAIYGQSSGETMLFISGNSQPHNNMPPYVVLNCIIALQGVFPPR
ncbi:MAG: phage tail protein, partial [Clostridiales bacterium]